MQSWEDAQKWEANWHDNCVNSYWEETKQQVYARKMGLVSFNDQGRFPTYDLQGKNVLDIGGGAYSLLLKCVNVLGHVVDPCFYPSWIHVRYRAAHITHQQIRGEDIDTEDVFDEVWIYNVLQHVENPAEVLSNARRVSKIIRLFEWIDNGISPGHLHDLKEDKLNEWLGGMGKVEQLNESGCVGKAYYGVFKGDHYETT